MVGAINALGSPSHLPQLLSEIEPYQASVLAHPLYAELNHWDGLRKLMSSHIFVVWDNMLLLKTLQQRLTCVTTPWLPPADAIAARLINEIILDEETEEIAPSQYLSHVEFYLAAMEELGADTHVFKNFLDALRQNLPLKAALTSLSVPHATQYFVLQTWDICQGHTAGIVAALVFGREEIVSPLFTSILEQLQVSEELSARPSTLLKSYCRHHLRVDESRHIPMARALLSRICGDDPQAWQQASSAAIATLMARKQLWDDLSASIASPMVNQNSNFY